jgi:hypothetical protein
MDGLWGVTWMAARIAIVTVRLPDPATEPEVAVITVAPAPVLVAIPILPGVSLIVATVGTDELQWVELVTSCVEPSVNVPAAVNAWFNPRGVEADVGFTVIETSAADVTVSGVDPTIEPKVALIVTVPVAIDVASALELTVANPAFPEAQVEEAVRS